MWKMGFQKFSHTLANLCLVSGALSLIHLLFLVRHVSSDMRFLCPEMQYDRFQVNSHSTPYGNMTAGHYTKYPKAKTLHDCVTACCASDTCNVAFFYNSTCFLLQCQSKELCEPLERSGAKFEKSFVVLVRPPKTEFPWNGVMTKAIVDLSKKLTVPDDDDEYFWPQTSPFHGDAEYDRTLETSLPQDVDQTANVLSSMKVKRKPCIYGIEIDCPDNEHCVTKNNRARSGVCHCNTGYVRDPVGVCRPERKSTAQIVSTASSDIPVTELVPVSKDNSTTESLPSSSSTAPPPVHLVVSAGDNVTLHLPENEVTLSAYALNPKGGEDFKYDWALISHPDGDETGTMQDQNTKNLKLSKLRAGLYTFKVTVTGANAVGEATVNVTVLPPEHPNKPPVAIIQPSNVTIKLPNKETVLDGSFSTDEDKISKYQWEVLQVPIGYSVQLNETPTLQLRNLLPGFYRFKLTVTDSKGASNFTFANVTVQKETDYPPTANAKSEVVIYLPQTEVTLNGNLSTDDHGIKVWEWKKSADTDKAVDMEGTNSPYLHLSQLEVGVYKFILKVTDTADQTSTTEVHLFVKPPTNNPPSAVTGPDIRVTLPVKEPVVLDGSHSKDDSKIDRYEWEQIVGPSQAVLVDSDTAIAKASGLVPGFYQFKLTVYDEKDSNSSALLNVTVIQTKNLPPHASAGGDKILYLPCDVVVMNGSASSDDVGIVRYKWTRDPTSLAAGFVLEKSDETAILKLAGLIAGRYLFRLTVFDAQGASSSDTASLIVKAPSSLMDQVEIIVNADIKSFTQEQEESVVRQLEMLLRVGDPVNVQLMKLSFDRNTRRVIMIIIAEKNVEEKRTIIPGPDVVARLKRKLRTDSSLLDLEILAIDTVVCQNPCSGHGTCDQYTKRCICEAFWMQNIFRLYMGDKESNCDWSILYVIIISFTLVVLLAGIVWGVAICCMRMHFRKPKKRHRYTLLDNYGDKDREREKFISRSKLQKSSLMMSESESDAIFESQRVPLTAKANGVSNGLVRDFNKVTA